MKSRWTKQGAHDAIKRWGPEHGEDFALRLYGARLLGADPYLVLHGGGNVSLKGRHRTLLGDEVEAIHVKASGWDLATLEPAGMPALDLAYLRRLRLVDALQDVEMVNEIRTHLFDASAPTPSIETLLHVFVPQKFVDHSHADAVLAVTNQPNGETLAREAMGDGVAIIPYVHPGFELAKTVVEACEANPAVDAVVLMHHGLVTFGDDAHAVYERHIALVDACERFIAKRSKGRSLTAVYHTEDDPAELAGRVAPMLRGLLAWPTGDEDHPYARSVLEWRATDAILTFVNSAEAKSLAAAGPLTGDHLIHTKPCPLFVENPPWSHEEALRELLSGEVEAYRRKYRAYLQVEGESAEAAAGPVPDENIDPSPRVVLMPGAGMFCWGRTKRQACITADITEHTLATKASAFAIGDYKSLPPNELHAMEYRTLQLAKLSTAEQRPLEGQAVMISGGAGAIGAAIADVCAQAGAHVVLADLNESRLPQVAERIDQRHGPGTALAVTMDVTDEASVHAGYQEAVRAFGGVDVIVPNAGIAHVAPIEELAVDDFRRVMDVNAVGYFLFMREGIKILKKQGLGGHIIVSASKNVFGPGKDFGAYSASKAAGHQLAKVAAIELAPDGIRVNMINADAIFGDQENPSGLWAEVGPTRARSRNLQPQDIPEYYRNRNLLKARIHGHHVGNAVVFFASNATPTTGATLPIDGGVVEAFPR